jgi:zinc transporter ZupT
MANFKNEEFPRFKRLLIAASFVIPVFLGATMGYWIVRGQPEICKLLLAFAAGVLVTGVVEEIVPEARLPRWRSSADLDYSPCCRSTCPNICTGPPPAKSCMLRATLL